MNDRDSEDEDASDQPFTKRDYVLCAIGVLFAIAFLIAVMNSDRIGTWWQPVAEGHGF